MSNVYGNPPQGINESRQSWSNNPNDYGTQANTNQSGFEPGFEDRGVQRRQGGWDNNASGGAQWTAGHDDSLGNTGYPGNTTVSNVPGTDQSHDNQGWDNTNQSSMKPSKGQRVMGTAEKMAGKMSGSTGMQQRGEQRRDNW